ncbi:MFS transporter [Geodermatophilus sp. SYSU D00079]
MAKRPLHLRDGSAARLVGAGLAVIAVTYGLARYGFGLYLPQFRGEFGISAGTAGWLAGGGYLAYCAAALLAPPLVARGRGRAALWAAGGSAAAGSVVVATATSTPVLAAGVLVAGSGAGAATPALVAAVAATVPPASEARAQAVVNSGTGAGVVAGGLLVLAAPGAWRAAWLGFAVLALLVTGLADRSARWSPPAGAPPRSAGRPWDRLGRATAAAVLAGAGCAGVWTFGRDLLTGHGGLAAGTSGALWCVLGAAGLAGGVSGALVERHGVRGAWCGSLLVAAAATAVLAVRPDVAVLAGVALAAFGSSFVALSGVLIAWGARARPDGAAAAAAFLFVGLTAGQALGAVGLGVLAARVGLPGALLVAAGTVLLAAGLAGRPRAPRRPVGAAGRTWSRRVRGAACSRAGAR